MFSKKKILLSVLLTLFLPKFKIANDYPIMFQLVNPLPHNLDPEDESFRKYCGKEEYTGYQHFLLFPQCYLPIKDNLIINSLPNNPDF